MKQNDSVNKMPSLTDKNRANRLNDLQVLSSIDSSDDPVGKYALRQIDFSSGGLGCGRKEFFSKSDALKALE